MHVKTDGSIGSLLQRVAANFQPFNRGPVDLQRRCESEALRVGFNPARLNRQGFFGGKEIRKLDQLAPARHGRRDDRRKLVAIRVKVADYKGKWLPVSRG
jgi:hypothetical protein